MLSFAFILFSLMSHLIEASDARSSFHANMTTEKGLNTIIETSKNNDPVSMAYKGLAQTMMAQYVSLPTSKLSYFNDGKHNIESAISKNKDNAELRYIRLMVQLNAPKMLGYYSSTEADINYLKQHLKEQIPDTYWRKKFINNLCNSDNISSAHKQKLTSIQ